MGRKGAITQEELNELISEHESWLKDPNQGKQLSLAAADLSGLAFSGDLTDSVFSGCDVSYSTFSTANLTKAALTKCDLSHSTIDVRAIQAKLDAVDLTGSRLSKSRFNDCKFTKVTLDRADLSDVHFVRGTFSQVDLSRATTTNVDFSDSSFSDGCHFADDVRKVNFSKCSFKDSRFTRCDFSVCDAIQNATFDCVEFLRSKFNMIDLSLGTNPSTRFTSVFFTRCALDGASLSGHDLRSCVFGDSTMNGTNLESAQCDNVVFLGLPMKDLRARDARFYRAIFDDADLRNAVLQDAHMSRSRLVNADLAGADLRRADLSMANLKGSNVDLADHRETNFRGAEYSDGRRCNQDSIGMCLTN